MQAQVKKPDDEFLYTDLPLAQVHDWAVQVGGGPHLHSDVLAGVLEAEGRPAAAAAGPLAAAVVAACNS